MKHRTISELMTRNVVSVRTDTPFKEIARLLADQDVSAVPVIDAAGRPTGVVSEADLLRKEADRPDPADQPGLLGRTAPSAAGGGNGAKAEAATAEEVMSSPPRCARPEWTVVEAARLMADAEVKRLPVVDETDRLVGIVSRGDLLRVFLRQDSALQYEIKRTILYDLLHLGPGQIAVDVSGGQVTLRGSVEDENLIPVIERLCTSVDGVVTVTCLVHAPGADASKATAGDTAR
ncbi:CBS domain-containing protein [Streptomyces sp. 8L]|uniref:CBS domain-containing protein n=1 Tax=Streptomyces sp. 8L TaxID=2877242 RepID=UPI001CD263EE|nr:CBS domain-containing protein [Streptomyces sp. 8L]MCA1221221.1 CBS domain-containing protein [Streptomyces sp. 8L]